MSSDVSGARRGLLGRVRAPFEEQRHYARLKGLMDTWIVLAT